MVLRICNNGYLAMLSACPTYTHLCLFFYWHSNILKKTV